MWRRGRLGTKTRSALDPVRTTCLSRQPEESPTGGGENERVIEVTGWSTGHWSANLGASSTCPTLCMSLLRLARLLARPPAHIPPCRPSHSPWVRSLATSAPPGPLDDPGSSPSHAPPVDAQQLSQLKHPSRGGQDLSRRYERLERSLRGKNVYGREIEDFQRSGQVTDPAPYTSQEKTQQATSSTGRSTRRIFRGFVVPEAPKPPADDGARSTVYGSTFPLNSCVRMLHVRLCDMRLRSL